MDLSISNGTQNGFIQLNMGYPQSRMCSKYLLRRGQQNPSQRTPKTVSVSGDSRCLELWGRDIHEIYPKMG